MKAIEYIKKSFTEDEFNSLTDNQQKSLIYYTLQKSNKEYNKQLAMGIKVEMEHTSDPKKAEKIARDHLKTCSSYYTNLKKMENKYCEEH